MATISRGGGLFHRFCQEVGVNECDSISLFDHHNVIDELRRNTAIKVGLDMDHFDEQCSVLLSYGHMHRRNVFSRENDWYPMVAEMDGYIFTDVRRGQSERVEVYQNSWMREICHERGYEPNSIVGMTGDKGQAAYLLGRPVILFDDKEENVSQVLSASNFNAGCVVRIGSLAGRRVCCNTLAQPQVSRNPLEWCDMAKRFHEDVLRASALETHRRLEQIRRC